MREPPPLPETLPWRTRHDLRFSDVDRQGHVSNGIFDRLMETSRVMLMDAEKAAVGDASRYVVARLEIDYFGELFFPGEVLAACAVERIGATSVTFRQALFNEDRCAAAARVVIVCLDAESGKPTAVSDALRRGLERWKVEAAPA